jgi:cell filamentation protein
VAADPYVYPGTDVLRNNLGIKDAVRLSAVEADFTSIRMTRLARQVVPGQYDLDHLRRFHREIFSAIYPWAGEVRTVTIAKGQVFALPQHIEPYLNDRLAKLASERHLRGLDLPAFVERVTHYFGEVNAVHPFREGNGRTQRTFFGQLARDAGYEIGWDRLDPARNLEASIASLQGDNSKLRTMLSELVEIDRSRPGPDLPTDRDNPWDR